MTIEEILSLGSPDKVIEALKQKSIEIPEWEKLRKEYDPKEHPVMTDPNYQDKATDDGIEKVTRITQDLQRLAVKRTTELVFGIPVKRIYRAETEGEKQVAQVIEAILDRNRIDSVNTERGNMLFAGCEVATLWYAVEELNHLYGVDSKLKVRCKSYSPMRGDSLYPLFDDTDDMVAMSFGYKRKRGDKDIEYFDVYTNNLHIRYVNEGSWVEEVREPISIMKIPVAYMYRPTPIWEDTSNIVYEIEWALSRNGNYLRANSAPIYVVAADEEIAFGEEKQNEWKKVFQYPKGSVAGYVTWEQATEALKFHVSELRQSFFTQLQLPDWSYENMKSTPMSGEARKMMFIDPQMKAKDESGRLIEMLDREINIIKAFVKIILPGKDKDIDSLQVETVITPFTIRDAKEDAETIMTMTGGKAIMSQEEGVQELGKSQDVDETMRKLRNEAMADITEPTL
nr:phage portal protein [Parabacteroides goldsteinii]